MKLKLIELLESRHLTVKLFETAELPIIGYGPPKFAGPYKLLLEVSFDKKNKTITSLQDFYGFVPIEILLEEIDCNQKFFGKLFAYFFDLGMYLDDVNGFLSLTSAEEFVKLGERLKKKSRFLSNSQFGLFTKHFIDPNREYFLAFTLIDLSSAAITTVDAFSVEAMQFYAEFESER